MHHHHARVHHRRRRFRNQRGRMLPRTVAPGHTYLHRAADQFLLHRRHLRPSAVTSLVQLHVAPGGETARAEPTLVGLFVGVDAANVRRHVVLLAERLLAVLANKRFFSRMDAEVLFVRAGRGEAFSADVTLVALFTCNINKNAIAEIGFGTQRAYSWKYFFPIFLDVLRNVSKNCLVCLPVILL